MDDLLGVIVAAVSIVAMGALVVLAALSFGVNDAVMYVMLVLIAAAVIRTNM